MEFYVKIVPPTVTAQEKKVSVVHGKPVFYEPAPLKRARRELIMRLMPFSPEAPLQGPLEFVVRWQFPRGKKHKNGEWRVTRPDTDNLEKLLKDCMTKCGFWKDDAQVVRETVEKVWSDEPTGIYVRIEELEEISDVQKS